MSDMRRLKEIWMGDENLLELWAIDRRNTLFKLIEIVSEDKELTEDYKLGIIAEIEREIKELKEIIKIPELS